MQKIRENVFETNSSSVHSIVSLFRKDETEYKGKVIVHPFDEESTDLYLLCTPLEKMSYMLAHLKYESHEEDPTMDERFKWMKEIWAEETCSELVYKKNKGENPFGYLNHQVIGDFSDYFWNYESEFKPKMRHLIFNANTQIELSHD